MATCAYCDRAMTVGATCVGLPFERDGEERPAIPFGRERRYLLAGVPAWPGPNVTHCHDCNVAVGGFHHPGCDTEECPLCGGQAISCDCSAGVDDAEAAD